MDTSSEGVNLRVRPTSSGEDTPPLGSAAYCEMLLLWEYFLLQKRRHDIDSDIMCDDRGPVGAA
jgi:hypothetical protein